MTESKVSPYNLEPGDTFQLLDVLLRQRIFIFKDIITTNGKDYLKCIEISGAGRAVWEWDLKFVQKVVKLSS